MEVGGSANQSRGGEDERAGCAQPHDGSVLSRRKLSRFHREISLAGRWPSLRARPGQARVFVCASGSRFRIWCLLESASVSASEIAYSKSYHGLLGSKCRIPITVGSRTDGTWHASMLISSIELRAYQNRLGSFTDEL